MWEEKRMSFAVFLDIDGVLNSRTTCERTHDYHVGIDDLRVAVLAESIKKYGSTEIVLSSDWKELRSEEDDYIYLILKLAKYGLELAGKTTDHYNNRGEGIQQYLESHPEIDEYVVLDDNEFDFRDYQNIWERLLLTNGIERAKFASKTPAIEAILFMDYIKDVS